MTLSSGLIKQKTKKLCRAKNHTLAHKSYVEQKDYNLWRMKYAFCISDKKKKKYGFYMSKVKQKKVCFLLSWSKINLIKQAQKDKNLLLTPNQLNYLGPYTH